ncbi:Protein disulfide-isomerase tmx3 [Schistosoma haematobium]|uniref:Protein disulfide-isomerase tmx3 n=1 Tax=Schistosoma haematobium TaxID=6185 RepID=A0A922LKX0_SCHHA|nr:Protein disulfide-isomerase tmx3 [Schistosoma haematobium]KAH9588151.1 Protein disulfide-isomerase tmx3 [Schistosoma haematobium]
MVNWIMKTSTSDGKHGIQWTAWMQSDNLDFADDLANLSHTHQQMQVKTKRVAAASASVGLKIHKGKSKVLKYNTENTNTIKLDGEILEELETSTYLRGIIDEQGGSDADLEKEIELEKLRRQKRGGSDQSVSNSENTILKNLYLPKRKVLRFDGTPTNYWNFIRNFEECIGSENIGFRAKLNYLIQYCDGEAKAAILHCTILEPKIGYHQALKLLEETFGPKHVIARTFIDNLLNFPNIRRNQPDGLRRLSREMQACSLTLEQMNYVTDLNSSRTIETMVLKLPTHIQQEWLKVAYKIIRGGREPLFTDLVEFVKEQAEIANTRYGLLVTVSFANTSESDVTPYVRPRTRGLSCLLCTGNHPLDQCERFRDKNVNEKVEFASRKKLCNVCLKANHIARNCRAPRSCAVEGCGWRHHTLLHRKREEQGDNNNNAHINTQLCTEEVVKCIQRPVAFAVVPV